MCSAVTCSIALDVASETSGAIHFVIAPYGCASTMTHGAKIHLTRESTEKRLLEGSFSLREKARMRVVSKSG